MKTKLILAMFVAAMFANAGSANAQSGLSDAKDMAYKIAEKLRGRGFTLLPLDVGDNSTQVQTVPKQVPVSANIDYAIIVTSDGRIVPVGNADFKLDVDLDVYVENEGGTAIVSDEREEADAFVQWTSLYNGSSVINLVVSRELDNGSKGYRRWFMLMAVRGGDPTPP